MSACSLWLGPRIAKGMSKDLILFYKDERYKAVFENTAVTAIYLKNYIYYKKTVVYCTN